MGYSLKEYTLSEDPKILSTKSQARNLATGPYVWHRFKTFSPPTVLRQKKVVSPSVINPSQKITWRGTSPPEKYPFFKLGVSSDFIFLLKGWKVHQNCVLLGAWKKESFGEKKYWKYCLSDQPKYAEIPLEGSTTIFSFLSLIFYCLFVCFCLVLLADFSCWCTGLPTWGVSAIPKTCVSQILTDLSTFIPNQA